jgi:valyl-tRNA synthetase
MNEKFLKPYNSVETESRIYELWEKSGFFNPDDLPADMPNRGKDGEPFSIVLPPPNVTGVLHMGSALMLAIEDIMVRYARMKGKKTLWIPGTDHAAIATQSVVEKDIQKKEGKSRHDLGREETLRRIGVHVKETHDIIVAQMRKMGCSIDWSREAFTLDEKRNLAVHTAFKKMYDDGLIYRGFRVVNWDPKGQTTISDDEIVYETRKTKLYTFKYGKDTNTGELIPISISTTRPETKLGDTAIAVHPDDIRYKKYVGKEYDAIFAGEPIHLKVIADLAVEKDFGTGALGVTPAHSQIDWEMGQKHGLPLKQVINEYARMTVGAEGIKDKKVVEAREAVVTWLKGEGLLEKEEDIEHNISLAERTGGVVEPLPKLQWFVALNKKVASCKLQVKSGGNTLKELMKEAVEMGINGSKPIEIIPDRFEKVYFNWIENLRDWCISRQIWYGHRIPVWYKKIEDKEADTSFGGAPHPTGDSVESCLAEDGANFQQTNSRTRRKIVSADLAKEDIYCGIEPPNGDGWIQDEDTLDTWFSSGLWTFSTLGWPEKTDDLKNYHPTTILETGSDILFFWVARMILMSTYLLNKVPFKTVYLHGLVRDTKNRKISKSLGNNIDPLDMITKYGADAVRMSLIVGVGPGNDSKIDEQKIKAYKLFSNKLWNIARFIFENTTGEVPSSEYLVPSIDNHDSVLGTRNLELYYTEIDLAHLKRLDELISEITKEMDEYKFYIVAEKLYHYAWHELADKILEESKKIFKEGTDEEKKSRRQLLLHTLDKLLRSLHPFMPYITEEIWNDMPTQDNGKGKSLLMVEEWPILS